VLLWTASQSCFPIRTCLLESHNPFCDAMYDDCTTHPLLGTTPISTLSRGACGGVYLEEGAQWMQLEIIQSTTRVLFLKMHGGSEEAQSGSALETHAHHPQHTYARPYPEAEFARARPQTRRCRLGHGISQVSARKVTARIAKVVRECVKVRGRQSRNHGDYCRED
jgi:hypothetical protein